MQATPVKTKGGATLYRPTLTEAEYREATREDQGFCLACKATAYECEPDARRYPCESCGAKQVYGLEELLMMDILQIA